MKLSRKKENELWKVINDCVLDARVAICKLGSHKNEILQEVDAILCRLGIDCPGKAINVFKPQQSNPKQ